MGPIRTVVLGRSVRALELGDPTATRKVLVVGVIHGNETAGRAVIRALLAAGAPPGTDLWLVDELNPDGVARGTRQNARGVDLNRNFPWRWRGGLPARRRAYPGPRVLSEPVAHPSASSCGCIRHCACGYTSRSASSEESGGSVASSAASPGRRPSAPPPAPVSRSGASWQNTRLPDHRVRGRAAGGPADLADRRRATARAMDRAMGAAVRSRRRTLARQGCRRGRGCTVLAWGRAATGPRGTADGPAQPQYSGGKGRIGGAR